MVTPTEDMRTATPVEMPTVNEALKNLALRTLEYVGEYDGTFDPALECDAEMRELALAGLAALAAAEIQQVSDLTMAAPTEASPMMITTHGPQGSELYLRAAKSHGEVSDPDHEVGDLQTFFRTAWLLMNGEQRATFVNHPDVRMALAAALGVDEDDPAEFRAALAEVAAATNAATSPNC